VTPDRKSLIEAHSEHPELAREYLGRLLDQDRKAASRLVLDAVDDGLDLPAVYLHVFQPSLWEVGRLWSVNELSIAEEHYATAATQLVMSQLYPRLFEGARRDRAMVATSVGGNLHEIGVRMVSDFFEMEGWDTLYLGANTPPDEVAESARSHEADLVALSVTLDRHLPALRDALDALQPLRQEGLKVLVGGAPFREDPDLWVEVGADGSGSDAREAIGVANQLMGVRA
jgi:methanogenic corrinoid protein MtbC1